MRLLNVRYERFLERPVLDNAEARLDLRADAPGETLDDVLDRGRDTGPDVERLPDRLKRPSLLLRWASTSFT
jgi:hypothetical protein